MGLGGLQTEPSGSAVKALVGSNTTRAFLLPCRMFFNNGDCVMCRGSASRRASRPRLLSARACAPARTPSTLAWRRWRSSRLQVEFLPRQPDFGLCCRVGRMRGGKEAIRQTHDLETAGSNPAAATHSLSNKAIFVLSASAGRTAPSAPAEAGNGGLAPDNRR